jgi:hypothetical protein
VRRGEIKIPCSLSLGLPTRLYSRNLNDKDDGTTFNVVTEDFIGKDVTGTRVNIVDVFLYEFPTPTTHFRFLP